MAKLVRMILRGPSWVPMLAGLLMVALSFGLRLEFAQEARPYQQLAAQPLPAPVAIGAYRAPSGSGPVEAALTVEVMTRDQIQIDETPGGTAESATYFLPFTAPPGSAEEGRILGGMVLSKQARDAFVQWAVTEAHPQLANYGIALTVPGLVERPAGAARSLEKMRQLGLPVSQDAVFLTPYSGRRADVLAARAAWLRDNPVQRYFLIAAAMLMLIALNRFAIERKNKRSEPEPLSLSKARDTAFERLNQLRAWAGADPDMEGRIVHQEEPRERPTNAAPGTADAPAGRLAAVWHLGRIWGGAVMLGLLLSWLFPALAGPWPLVAGVLIVPCALVLRRAFRPLRRTRGGGGEAAAQGGAGAGDAAAPSRQSRFGRARRLHKSVTVGNVPAEAGGRT